MGRGVEIRSSSRVTHNKHTKYDSSDLGRARQDRNNERRREISIDRYMSKEFVAWDGEGGNEDDGSHTYFILANSDGAVRTDRAGLSTVTVLEMFLEARQGVWNVIYGGGYDINMLLRDVDRDTLEKLYTVGKARWGPYFMEWRGGKSFSVSAHGRRFLLYDVVPFFQCTFVKACDEYLGTDWPNREEIIREKAKRGTFEWDQMDVISSYNRSELSTLVNLVEELRTRLFHVDIRVSRWDGPGAIASALYKRYAIKSFMGSIDPGGAEAPRYGYAGGRFEIIRKGHSESGAFQYDLRSAYPAAARHLPCLAHGHWEHRHFTGGRIRGVVPFGIYRIEVVNPQFHPTQPQPLWMRNKDGTVFFSEYSHGWYWSPEAQLAMELGGVNVYEGWEWNQECDHEPFNFVEPLYNKRAALKKAGDGAHVGLKLGLNSLYGKLAQQIGWEAGPPLKLPPYHSLEWAGWITSHCRSQVFRGAMLAPDDIIAFETDAVFSRVPLPLTLGDRLGEWEATEYSDLTYLKSGMYYGTQVGTKDGIPYSKPVEKTRGINKGTMTRHDVITALSDGLPTLQAEQTRFVGLGQALHQDFGKWRRWYTNPRQIGVNLNGKRIDLLSGEDSRKDLQDGWKETQEGFHNTTFSHEYPIAWAPKNDAVADATGLEFEEKRLRDAHDELSD